MRSSSSPIASPSWSTAAPSPAARLTRSAPMPTYVRPIWATRSHLPRHTGEAGRGKATRRPHDRRMINRQNRARPLLYPPPYDGGGRRELVLNVRDLTAHYGASQALFGMALSVEAGEVVTLMGRNGMGKTTTVNAIMGLLPARRGAIEFEGRRIDQLPSFRIARLGLGLVPEGRQIFPNLSVRENLVAAAANRTGRRNPWTLRRVLDFFPRLGERQRNLGNQLSGGEQQMLAIGRALTTNPKLLILDEATEGLAPLIRQDIWSCLGRLKAEGQAILVIDKNVGALIGLADRHHIVEKGRVVWAGSSAALARDGELQHRYLGV